MFDGVFNDLIKDKSSNDKESVKTNIFSINETPDEKPIKTLDPRPDLSRDTIPWQQMLASAGDLDPSGELYAALLYMRTKGTLFIRVPKDGKDGKKYACILRPRIDPTGNTGWMNVDEYEREKRKVLDPVRDKLIELLKIM
jgi:hypothetical protein